MRAIILAAALTLSATQASAITVFSASGAAPGNIQGTVDAFRTALGTNNGNAAGSQGSGRREINWDGGGAGAPATVFASPQTNFANRGATFTTPGTGTEQSGLPLPEFGEINPTYPDIFTPFSAPRIFAPLGSTITDVLFNIPGQAGPAVTNAFGAVFLDVDAPDVSRLDFFGANGDFLAGFFVPTANNGLSFVGVVFDTPDVARVRITSGSIPLGPNDGAGGDVVALDDFIFGEPLAAPIPEPGAWVLTILGFGLAGALVRQEKGRALRRAPVALEGGLRQ